MEKPLRIAFKYLRRQKPSARNSFAQINVLQETLAARKGRREIPNLLLLLEPWDPVFTGGRRCQDPTEIESKVYAAAGAPFLRVIPSFEINWGACLIHSTGQLPRGGQITFHGPGQLIGYPILDLREMLAPRTPCGDRKLGLSVRCHVHALEETLIRVLHKGYGLSSAMRTKDTGVWIAAGKDSVGTCDSDKDRKIAALGKILSDILQIPHLRSSYS